MQAISRQLLEMQTYLQELLAEVDVGQYIMCTFVYDKCSSLERLNLWDNLYYLASDMDIPWVVGGEFNVVLYEDEKIGGLPVHPPEYKDFSFCVNSCGLFDLGYKGSPFTWWNDRLNAECILKRLDRVFLNLPFKNLFPTIDVEHLIRTGSDHAPLFMSCGEQATNFIKPFREDIMKVKEMLFEEEPTVENRVLQKAQAELKRYLSIEEQYWKQKAGVTLFTEEDRNTSFFHNHRQFTREADPPDFILLDNVPAMVTMEQNLELCRYPTLEEVKVVVFELSGRV
ncbi:uncharacterized protein LOC142168167 [Nicotiana tabacum]|uniref:Uncharacterized protein LOC142168167 n=1 Tax=Nicotiana tabacum TaxID=4097 RepID=A0AC58SIZ0_TOBAC